MANNVIKVYSVEVDPESDYTDNVCLVATDLGRAANEVELVNLSAQDISVKVNNSATAVFTLLGNDRHKLNLRVSQINLQHAESSGATTAIIEVIAVR